MSHIGRILGPVAPVNQHQLVEQFGAELAGVALGILADAVVGAVMFIVGYRRQEAAKWPR